MGVRLSPSVQNHKAPVKLQSAYFIDKWFTFTATNRVDELDRITSSSLAWPVEIRSKVFNVRRLMALLSFLLGFLQPGLMFPPQLFAVSVDDVGAALALCFGLFGHGTFHITRKFILNLTFSTSTYRSVSGINNFLWFAGKSLRLASKSSISTFATSRSAAWANWLVSKI